MIIEVADLRYFMLRALYTRFPDARLKYIQQAIEIQLALQLRYKINK